MSELLEFKIVPGFEKLCVTNNGIVLDSITLNPIYPFKLGKRWSVTSEHYDGWPLAVHKLVALTWVKNPDPVKFNIVNHLDGNPLNNHYTNLEWTDTAGNNLHAVNNGLRVDTISCKVRDFETGVVTEFPSRAQASVFMGLSKTTHKETLRPKQFGKLISDRYEFRDDGDDEPWFYEGRTEKITPARYKIVVTDKNGTKKEVFSTRTFLKEYQLYEKTYGASIPGLVRLASEKYPDLSFEIFDKYGTETVSAKSRTKSFVSPVKCVKDSEEMVFKSITECADHFKVDRSLIKNRLGNPDWLYNGWKILPCHSSS